MIKWRFDLYRGGLKVAELVQVGTIDVGFERNFFKKVSFDYNANKMTPELKSTLIAGSELRILRKAYNQTTLKEIWAGEIQRVVKKVNAEGVKTLNVEVEHWANIYLKARFPSLDVTNREESLIAWDLIAETQTNTYSGDYTIEQVDLGIVQGVLETTGNNRDRTYTEAELLKMEQQLADVQDQVGVDATIRGFRITPDLIDPFYKRFSYYKNYGVVRNITYTNSLIQEVTEVDSIESLANRLTVTGKDDLRVDVTTDDQEHLDFYKMRHAQISRSNIETEDALLETAQEELAVRLSPAKVYSVNLVPNDPFIGEYREGDILYFKYVDDEDFITLDQQMRVFAINLTYNGDKVEQASITIAEYKPVSTDITVTDRLISKINKTSERVSDLEK